jgi:hypothetical protein
VIQTAWAPGEARRLPEDAEFFVIDLGGILEGGAMQRARARSPTTT